MTFGDPFLIDSGGLAGVEPIRSSEMDVTGDGLVDLVLHFSVPEMVDNGVLNLSTELGRLLGSALGEIEITGHDFIRIVPPNRAAASVPEPSAMVLAVAGLLGIVAQRWRRQNCRDQTERTGHIRT